MTSHIKLVLRFRTLPGGGSRCVFTRDISLELAINQLVRIRVTIYIQSVLPGAFHEHSVSIENGVGNGYLL